MGSKFNRDAISTTVSASDFQKFCDLLKKERLKLTPQRVSVYEEMCGVHEHRDAESIYLALRKKHKRVSRATVYRTMDLLLKHRLVSRLNTEDGRWRYEHWLDCFRHDHLICIRCGRIAEFTDEEIASRQERIAKQFNYKLVRHVHNLFGLCQDCHSNA